MSKQKKFLFFYLKTGAGHISTARVVKDCLQSLDKDCQVIMYDGLDKNNKAGIYFFEHGYKSATNIFHGLYPLAYDIAQHRFFPYLIDKLLGPRTVRYLSQVIEKEQPTDIVSFHFFLSPLLKKAIRKVNPNINLTVMVTDPFTAPNVWFYDNKLKYLVYSNQAKEIAMQNKVPEQNITVVPFALNPKYNTSYTKDDVIALKKKHGFDLDKKILLMVGGGEGIPGAIEFINKCILKKAKFSVAIICGKDAVKKTYFEGQKLIYPKLDIHVYGFIDYLDELVKISDCVLMKAGPATLIEVLTLKKPVIICRYIHNQEKGNMQFAVNNKVGFFIQKAGRIYDKVEELLNDKDFDKKMSENFDNLNINTDTTVTAKILLGIK